MLTKRIVLLSGLTAIAALAYADQNQTIRFNEQVRPILSENCFHCHGPDEAGRAAGLRLDVREEAVDYGAIVPNEPDESLIIKRIASDDPDLVMPPPETHKTLTDEQKQVLRDWVAAGAEYEQLWSFRPIPVIAEGDDRTIDSFVDAQIERRGLEPSPAASLERWLRRVTFDLTGLPPTVEEVEAFLKDAAAGNGPAREAAYEHVVDRLFDSPRYGERMAAEWLDVARYSDTYGYQVDRDRFVWPWRDWVIRAFNDNLPYDDFIVQQLAGDLLPNASRDEILATTFGRLHPQKVEGGSVEEEFRVEYVVDRVQTMGTAFMGLTLECCRCHDHKFDPISQREFYELNAFFANINESGLYSFHTDSVPTPTLELPTEKQEKELAEAEQEIAALGDIDIHRLWEEASDRFLSSRKSGDWPYDQVDLSPVARIDFDSPDAEKLPGKLVEGVEGKAMQFTGDHGIEVGPADFRRWQPFSVSLWMQTPDKKDRAVVFHKSLGWTDAASRGYQLLIEEGKLSFALVHYWPGNAICVRTESPIPPGEWRHVVVAYDGSTRAEGLAIYVNGKQAFTEIVQDGLTKAIATNNVENIVIGERTRDRGFKNGIVDSLQVYDRRLSHLEVSLLHANEPLGQLNDQKLTSRIEGFAAMEIPLIFDNEFRQLNERIEQARKRRDQIRDQIPEIMVMRELHQPRETYFLNRGVYDQRGDLVSAETPAALPPLPKGAPKNRLGLAKWLTSPEHPLTARVTVNRYWQLMFGRGLVRTTEDFGSQGSPPTHPELLVWLARRFIDSGWDVKALLKQMALSQAYRRDSTPTDETQARDPENLYLARGPAAPLTAEMIRDAALATSGLLSEKIGGPPAKPYELAVSFKPINPDTGEGLYRRSLYTFWKRTAPAPVMLTLDASTRDVCRVRRERTSSPLQAMVLMNGPQYVEAAHGAATEVLQKLGENATPEALVTRLLRRLIARTPRDNELEVLLQLYDGRLASFNAKPKATETYVSVGEFKEPEEHDKPQLAALAIVAQAIMNLDEYLMKR